MNRHFRSFSYGMIAMLGFTMLHQDWMGREKYLEYVQHHWINLHWSIGAIAIVLAVCAAIGNALASEDN